MQEWQPLRLELLGTAAQHLGKQLVIAIPAPLPIERNQEQVLTLQLVQHQLAVGGIRRRIVAEQEGIAERAGQLIEDGGVQQEALDMARLLLEHIFDQVIEDEAMAAG